MTHFEVNGKEIMLTNVEGNYYAINDRSGHMNARLSMGTLSNTIVTCPQHFSRIRKRDGQIVKFDQTKIVNAANNAVASIGINNKNLAMAIAIV